MPLHGTCFNEWIENQMGRPETGGTVNCLEAFRWSWSGTQDSIITTFRHDNHFLNIVGSWRMRN